MRVTGGIARGIQLRVPTQGGVRPATDYIREAVFNSLAAFVPGTAVLDLFAGTGALGIEALSRGAKFTLFVDDTTEGRALVRGNVDALGLGGVSRIFRRDATKMGPMPPQEPYTLAFLDPPYGKRLAEPCLLSLRDGGWLAPDALCVVEESTEAAFEAPDGFEELERRVYGGTQVVFLRAG